MKPYAYTTDQIHALVSAPKELRRPELLLPGKPLPFTAYGERGRRIDLDLELTSRPRILDFRFHVRAPIFDNLTTFEAALILAGERVRGFGWDAVGRKRFYKQTVPKGWHQNIVDPNLPAPDRNRHIPTKDFAPSDLMDFFRLAARNWNIKTPVDEVLL